MSKAVAVSGNRTFRKMSGAHKCAALMIALGREHGIPIWERLDEIEIRDLSIGMSSLGPITADMLGELLKEVIEKLSSHGDLMGNHSNTEKLLLQFMPEDQVRAIMEDIRGPAGRNMWEKLSNVPESTLANFLKGEYPQTVAVVMSKIAPQQSAKVLSILPEDFALEVIDRMLKMGSVKNEVIQGIEETLRKEFITNLVKTSKGDSYQLMAEIFNGFDRQTEARFIAALEENFRDDAEKIKNLMFTFDDLKILSDKDIQVLLRSADKDKMTLALKGANEEFKKIVFRNMSQRAAEMMQDEMENMGPVRLKEVDEAQNFLVGQAKDLAAIGEISISKNEEEDELVY